MLLYDVAGLFLACFFFSLFSLFLFLSHSLFLFLILGGEAEDGLFWVARFGEAERLAGPFFWPDLPPARVATPPTDRNYTITSYINTVEDYSKIELNSMVLFTGRSI